MPKRKYSVDQNPPNSLAVMSKGLGNSISNSRGSIQTISSGLYNSKPSDMQKLACVARTNVSDSLK